MPGGPKTVGPLAAPLARARRGAARARDLEACAARGSGCRAPAPGFDLGDPGHARHVGRGSARGRERSPPPARRSASESSERRGFSRAGPGAERKTIGDRQLLCGSRDEQTGQEPAVRGPRVEDAAAWRGRATRRTTCAAIEISTARSSGNGFWPFSMISNTLLSPGENRPLALTRRRARGFSLSAGHPDRTSLGPIRDPASGSGCGSPPHLINRDGSRRTGKRAQARFFVRRKSEK